MRVETTCKIHQFQFHDGTIDSMKSKEQFLAEINFNSTMVRLIAVNSQQSHTHFNSTMVRLIGLAVCL